MCAYYNFFGRNTGLNIHTMKDPGGGGGGTWVFRGAHKLVIKIKKYP